MNYILDEHGVPQPCPSVLVWARWYETADRVVFKTDVGPAHVSTVFLGIDHSYGTGPPLLYETMIFVDGDERVDMDDSPRRYTDLAAAVVGHAAAVTRVRTLYGLPEDA
jgi:hypothetical protein